MRRLFGQGLTPNQLQTLTQANRLAANNQSQQAAPLFTALAQEMEASQHPRRAANLHAQASHAFADSSNGAQALFHARTALSLFIQYQMAERTPRFYNNITQKMHNHGMVQEATALEKEFGPGIAGQTTPTQPAVGATARGRLPAACPKCGAPVHSGEVNWLDATSAECDFCGSVLQTS